MSGCGEIHFQVEKNGDGERWNKFVLLTAKANQIRISNHANTRYNDMRMSAKVIFRAALPFPLLSLSPRPMPYL